MKDDPSVGREKSQERHGFASPPAAPVRPAHGRRALASGLSLLVAWAGVPSLHAAEDVNITTTTNYTTTQTVQADNTITTSAAVNVGSSANVTYQAGAKVTLGTGFSVTSGGLFRVQIGHILPYAAGFESGENFTTGSIHQQRGWFVHQGAAEIGTAAYYAGSRSLALNSGATAAVVSQRFLVSANPNTVFFDLRMLPVAAASASASSVVQSESALFGFQLSSGVGVVHAYDGVGANTWVATAQKFLLDGSNRAAAWHRFTVRADYVNKSWDLYVDDALAEYDLAFLSNSETFLRTLALAGTTGATAYADAVAVQETNPLFTDADKDGMPDSWEPGGNVTRGADHDGDGLTNIQEYLLNSSPSNADITAPSAPALVQVIGTTASSVTLAWSASSDPSGAGTTGLAGYNVYSSGVKVNSSLLTTASFTETGLTAATAYSYTVRAVDLAGNVSAASAAAIGTTLTPSSSGSFEVFTPLP